ncbi:hypothetical protein [Planococcus lenghuensis]|uniref:hypothetical protein n=1 Tax=Planococcus lenghuensis TaxID=2213202 RepID=UPI0012EC85AC|nr:hypothetical protein [Planococcus lenghuensis]
MQLTQQDVALPAARTDVRVPAGVARFLSTPAQKAAADQENAHLIVSVNRISN